MSAISFSQAKDAELAWVEGQIHFDSSTSSRELASGNANVGNKELNAMPILDALTSAEVRRRKCL